MQKSFRTTISGSLGGIGLILTAIQLAFASPEPFLAALFTGEALTLLVSGLGVLANGLVGRDDKVSSEGEIAPKAR